MTTKRIAQCQCGQLSAEVTGDTDQVFMCHCEMCQRRSGSAFHIGAWYPQSDVAVTGEAREYRRVGDAGAEVYFRFCPECGTTVIYGAPELFSDRVGIPVGCFADPDFPIAKISLFERSKHRWVNVPEEIPGIPAWPEGGSG